MKISLVIVTILLVVSFAFGGNLWYQLGEVKAQLSNTRVELEGVKDQLNSTVVKLNSVTVQLGDTKNMLNAAENQLVEVETELGNTKTELKETEAKLNITENQLQISSNDNSQMLAQYSGFKQQIANRLGSTKEDKQGFITPDNYSVSTRARAITGGYSEDPNEYWRDMYRLYQWVVNNISYSYDSYVPVLPEVMSGELKWHNEYWRLPEETLEEGTGDCEDMATLIVSLMRNYNEEKFAVLGVSISSKKSGNPGHIGAAFPVIDGRLTIVDPAGNYYTGYGSLDSESYSVAVNRWLAHWARDIPEAFISGVFTDDFYYNFSNTDEFLSWLEEKYD
ncbi:transglutaminase-like domain-containing protein [Chloroflexota bacterium]